jgi:sulfur carrier protein
MLSLEMNAPVDVRSGAIKLVVQGKPLHYAGARDVGSLLASRGENSLYVNVRINGEVLDRRDFENVPIQEGDRLDFLYFMGGGLFVQPDRRRN